MPLRHKTACVIAHLCGGFALVDTSFAQQTASDSASQRLEITGSSLGRVDAESALPTTIIRRAAIEASGATTAQELVQRIPANFGGTVIASNVGSNGNASTANLRALGEKYTLVLLNGRRLASYAFGNAVVDLNAIPLAAIEQVEILRDGASAIYGADAVAGVINFILRQDYQGLEASGSANWVEQGGGQSRSAHFTAGFGDLNQDRYNLFLSGNREHNAALKARDRPFASSANRPDLGINKASPRNGIPNLNFTDSLGNTYVEVNPLRYQGCNSTEFNLLIRDAKTCGTDYVKFIDLIPQTKHQHVLARLVFQLNPATALYAEAASSQDHLISTYSPAPYTKEKVIYPVGGRWYPSSIIIPKGYVTTGPYRLADGTLLPTGSVLLTDLAVTPSGPISGSWRTSAGGGRSDLTESTSSRYVAGIKGLLAGWEFDAAFSTAKHHGLISFGPGKYSYSKLSPFINSGEINIFGSQDAASLSQLQAAALTGPQQSASAIAQELELRLSKDLALLPAGPIALAFGASLRTESLRQRSFPVLESGDEVGGAGPIPSVTGSRKITALFSELNLPLHKQLELQLAGRYDRYKNNFGSAFSQLSPKLALRYQPSNQLVLRSSYGSGYRAPTLYENLLPFSTGNHTERNFSDPLRCPSGVPISSINPVGTLQDECNVQLNTGLAGSKNLKPETAQQFSLGTAFVVNQGLNASIDYWRIDIKQAIVKKSETQVFSDPVRYQDSFYRYDPRNDPNQRQPIQGSTNPDFPLAYVFLPFENTARVFAAGIDTHLDWRKKIGPQEQLAANFDATLFTKHGYRYQGLSSVSDLGRYQDFGPAPRWRHALTFSYARADWSAALSQNYTAGYSDYTLKNRSISEDYPASRQVSAYLTYDFQGLIRPSKNLEISLGIKNLLNQDPPSSRTEKTFQVGYDAQLTNPLGRTFYCKVRYKFF